LMLKDVHGGLFIFACLVKDELTLSL
jgi:hypothetical protein